MRNILFLLIAGAIITFGVSCQECEPQTIGSNQMNIAFFDKDSLRDEGIDHSISLNFDSIYVDGFAEHLFTDDTAANFTLPLSPIKDTTSFVFALHNTFDTLTVAYEILNKVNSPDCGLSTEILNLQVLDSTNSFDTLILIKDIIDFSGETNIKMYK